MPGLTAAPMAAAPGQRGDPATSPGGDTDDTGAFALLLAPGGAGPARPTPAPTRPTTTDDAPITEAKDLPDLAGQMLAVLDNPLALHQDAPDPQGAALPAEAAAAPSTTFLPASDSPASGLPTVDLSTQGGPRPGTVATAPTSASPQPTILPADAGSAAMPLPLHMPLHAEPGAGPAESVPAPAGPAGTAVSAVAGIGQAPLSMSLVASAPGDPTALPFTLAKPPGEEPAPVDVGSTDDAVPTGLERLHAPPPPGGLAQAARAATPPPAAITMPQVPAEGFDDGFAARIGWMAGQGLGRAELHVHPDDVGPIEVRLQLDGNRLHAEFHSANADVRQALEASMSRLRDLLGQQGLQLAQSHVGQGGSGGRDAPRHGAAPSAASGEATADELAPLAHGGRPLRGLVDEYA